MTEKFDSFGTAQRCASCKIIWRKGDGQLSPRRANYGKRSR